MMNFNVAEALAKAASLCPEMRESADLCNRLLERLLFLRGELGTNSSQLVAEVLSRVLSQLAFSIGLAILFLKKYAVKKLLPWLAASRVIRE